MAQARQGKLVRTQDKKTFMDFYVGALCLYFDLVYPRSQQLAREQGYLDRLLDFHSQNADSEGKLEEIRRLIRRTGTLPQPSFIDTIYRKICSIYLIDDKMSIVSLVVGGLKLWKY